MKLIANADRNWGIGKNGGLLLHIPEDMQRFKAVTMGKSIVMGRKTLESLPGSKPLPGRKNIVLTRDRSYSVDGAIICHSPDEVDSDAIVIGGGEIYSLLLDKCDTAYITRVDFDGDADTFMPPLDNGWDLVESEEKEYGEIKYRFETYKKRSEIECKKI